MLDFMNMAKALPEVTKMLPQVQEFMAAWLQFMNRIGEKTNRIESLSEVSANNSATIIERIGELDDKLTMFMSETSLTQDMQDSIEHMSMSDPRQAELKPAWVGNDGRKIFFPSEVTVQIHRFP
jgi:hypothetical protein